MDPSWLCGELRRSLAKVATYLLSRMFSFGFDSTTTMGFHDGDDDSSSDSSSLFRTQQRDEPLEKALQVLIAAGDLREDNKSKFMT
jgi:hypothetical protein